MAPKRKLSNTESNTSLRRSSRLQLEIKSSSKENKSASDNTLNCDTAWNPIDVNSSSNLGKGKTGKKKKKDAEIKAVKTNTSVLCTKDINKTKSLSEKDKQSEDIFSKILKSKQKIYVESTHKKEQICVQMLKNRSDNIVQSLYREQSGIICPSKPKQNKSQPVIDIVNNLSLYRVATPFDRRCSSLDWHPTNPNVMAVGSKGGDIILWNIHQIDHDVFIQGRGPGGSISAMKFHPHNPTKIYTAALDGKLSLQDMQQKCSDIFLDTMTWDFWYCSMDFQSAIDVMVAGENSGKLTLLSMKEGKKIWTEKLHKDKITHTEFSPREPWLLSTASTDKTCKLWDIRMIKNQKSCLCTLQHERPINSAYFSLTDGTRLLTTDQNNEIRIYRAPAFFLESTIHHPHRFFQHITPIKANWHPLQDLVIVGRYPDKNFPGWTETEARTIDVFYADTGKLVSQIYDPNAPGIISLNKFGQLGDTLASTMGVNILVWRQNEDIVERQEKLLAAMNDSVKYNRPRSTTHSQQRQQHRSQQRPQNSKPKQVKSEQKILLKTKFDTKESKGRK